MSRRLRDAVCAKALAGIADPAAAVARWRAIEAAAIELCKWKTSGDPPNPPTSELVADFDRLRDAMKGKQ